MSGPFDKFVWHRSVTRDRRIPPGERLVLGDVIHSVLHGGDLTFCVRQDTIAERLGVSRRTVNGAMTRAKRLGYLIMNRRRPTGSGRHGADELRLSLPESCEESSHHSTESCEANSQSHVKQTQKSCEAANAPTSENDVPKVLYKGSVEGSAPNPRCPKHINDPYPPACGACADARRNHEAWTEQVTQVTQSRNAAIRGAIDDCPDCDAYGRLDDLSDCPKHPNFRKAAA